MAVEQGPQSNFPPVLPLEQLVERFSGEDKQYIERELELRDQMTPEEYAERKLQRQESTLSNLESLIASGSVENFLADSPVTNPQQLSDSNSPQGY